MMQVVVDLKVNHDVIIGDQLDIMYDYRHRQNRRKPHSLKDWVGIFTYDESMHDHYSVSSGKASTITGSGSSITSSSKGRSTVTASSGKTTLTTSNSSSSKRSNAMSKSGSSGALFSSSGSSLITPKNPSGRRNDDHASTTSTATSSSKSRQKNDEAASTSSGSTSRKGIVKFDSKPPFETPYDDSNDLVVWRFVTRPGNTGTLPCYHILDPNKSYR